MTTVNLALKLFKADDISRHLCCECNLLMRDAVQLGCGHRLCKSCADELVASPMATCPDCKEDIEEEDGAKVGSNILLTMILIQENVCTGRIIIIGMWQLLVL